MTLRGTAEYKLSAGEDLQLYSDEKAIGIVENNMDSSLCLPSGVFMSARRVLHNLSTLGKLLSARQP